MLLPACLALLSVFAMAQDPAPKASPTPKASKDDEDVLKAGPKDPYTGKEEALMRAAGVVGYGPLLWADGKGTADVDKVLGEGRVLWMETEHFRIGLNLKSTPLPEDSKPKKALLAELEELRKVLPKVPSKPRKVDPWLRLHLAARRCEKAYNDVQALVGATAADFPARGKGNGEGPFLGMPEKFLVLLFQKKSDLARYADRFCGRKEEQSLRHFHTTSQQLLFGMAADGLEGFDEAGLHGHMLYAVIHNLVNGLFGYHYSLPMWLDEGIAHWFSRQVDTEMINANILDTEAVAEDKQANWAVKVRRRAQHDGAYFLFEQMAKWQKFEEMGYHAHSQSWSRVDYLMKTDQEKFGLLLRKLKTLPVASFDSAAQAQLAAQCERLLLEVFEIDSATFDQRWREWVLKTYPKK